MFLKRSDIITIGMQIISLGGKYIGTAVVLITILLTGVVDTARAATMTCVNSEGVNVEINMTRPTNETCADHGMREYVDTSGPQADYDEHGNKDGEACGVGTVILGCSGGGGNPIYAAFMEVFNFFAIGIGILVVAGIIMGGIRYATAGGNTGQAQQGISIITNAVIGLLLFLFMYALINWLVPGGLFH